MPVRLLQQLGLLVLGGRVEPEAGATARRSGGRPRGARPCARRGSARLRAARGRRRPIPCTPVPCVHNRRLMDDTHLCPETSGCPRTRAAARRPAGRPASCCATGFPTARRGRGDGRHDLSPISPTASPASRVGPCSRSTSAAPARRRATSRSAAGSHDLRAAVARARRATRRARRVDRGLRSRRDVRGVRSGRRRPRARRRDDRGAEHVARLGARPARLLAHAREMGMIRTAGFPSDVDAWGREHRARRRRSTPRSRLDGRPLLVAARRRRRRGAGRRRPRARRRRPAQRRAAARAGRGPPPAPRPARDRHAPRLARPSGLIACWPSLPPGDEVRPTTSPSRGSGSGSHPGTVCRQLCGSGGAPLARLVEHLPEGAGQVDLGAHPVA